MTEKKKTLRGSVEVVRRGDQVILPQKMSYDEAIQWLERQKKHEEEEVTIGRTFDAFMLEGAYAFQQALDELFGWTQEVFA